MKTEILVFGSRNFNSTIQEIKKSLEYEIIFYDFLKPLSNISQSLLMIIIDNEVLNNKANLNLINRFRKIPTLLIKHRIINNQINFYEEILFPLTLSELKYKIKKVIATFNFESNSSIKIKNYLLNKNEKKLFKSDVSISLTEREVQLIDLLFIEKKPLSKNIILKKIWNYSESTDTHTVETHIYRLRKKIKNKFKDDDFIINSVDGYFI